MKTAFRTLPLLLALGVATPATAAQPNIIVILADDLGWADLGAQGAVRDLKTPHLDALAAGGVRCSAGYVTAPQCSPSRAAILTGRHQQRFGIDEIPDLPLPREAVTLAERLGPAGYRCGFVGKWHLEPNPTCVKWMARELPGMAQKPQPQRRIPLAKILDYAPSAQGFHDYFWGEMRRYRANFGLDGRDLQPGGEALALPDDYRIEVQTRAALAFIERNAARPFYLHLGYYGPHTPLEAPQKYLDRFPGPMPERRRYALAMIAAIDDGVGEIMARLRARGIEEKTLVIFTSDNGAPLKMTQPDSPVTKDPGGWDGSLNTPWVGEKGMLSEGGLRVPMVFAWKGTLPAGKVYPQPVSSLDFAATANAVAGLPGDAQLDGVNVLPFLTGEKAGPPHAALYWRFWDQAAVREGRWKYLSAAGIGEFLFDLESDAHERRNLIAGQRERASALRSKLAAWSAGLQPPGLPSDNAALREAPWYRFYFNAPAAREAAPPAALPAAGTPSPAARPNVVFILADDLGWSDTTLFGTTRFCETPNIERLAKRGMVFSNAYAANPLCSPTRASIMTGLYPARIGITAPCCHEPAVRLAAELEAKSPAYHRAVQAVSASRLKPDYYTLAEAFHDAGYATGHFGKWHLGEEPYSPLQQGFDVDVPHHPGPGPAGSYVAPWRFATQPPFTGQPGEHLEDRMAGEALRFLKANKDRPFFLNYWAFSVHAPFDAKPELVAKYRAKADPADPQRCPTYGAMVQSLDENVGRLLDTLDELKLTDKTIIVFFSDNGGNTYSRVEGLPPTSNAPLRGGKATLYDGGTREPCAVVWPGRVKPGSRSGAFLSSVDWYPTLLSMAGVKPRQAVAFDGVDQTPALLGTGAPRDTLFCYFPHYTPATGALPAAWVRRGDWKLIRFFCANPDRSDLFELYNLKEDVGEIRNLAAAQPERVRELDGLIAAFLKETGALVPPPNPAYDPAAQPPPDKPARKAAPNKALKKQPPNLRTALEKQGDEVAGGR